MAGGERFSRRTGFAPVPEPCCVKPINDQKYIHDNLTFMILEVNIQGVSKKRYFCDFLSYFSSRGRILLFDMCFGIRILSLFHLAI